DTGRSQLDGERDTVQSFAEVPDCLYVLALGNLEPGLGRLRPLAKELDGRRAQDLVRNIERFRDRKRWNTPGDLPRQAKTLAASCQNAQVRTTMQQVLHDDRGRVQKMFAVVHRQQERAAG